MALTLADLFTSPDHYLHSFDGDEAVFVAMDRAAYRRSIFLDRRIAPAATGVMRVPVAALLGRTGPAPRTAWIFHVAHCGSTLLARALDALGASLVLREPLALRQAALAGDPALLDLALRMVAKRYPGTDATVVKATVPVNFSLAAIAARDPTAAAIILHYGLRDYLLAILRNANHRQWLRHVTGELAAHLSNVERLADGELAAALWLAQYRRFAAALETMREARTLEAERFFASPVETLAASATTLGIAASEREVAAIVASDLFASYSKNPGVRFTNADRVARRVALEAELAGEVAAGERWLADNGADVPELASKIASAALAH